MAVQQVFIIDIIGEKNVIGDVLSEKGDLQLS